MPAGKRRERIAFYTQSEVETSYGIAAGDWEHEFTMSAQVKPMRGTEPVQAQRLKGIKPVEITILSTILSRQIDPSWQARDARTGEQYQIRATIPDEKRREIVLICESGVAQ